MIIWMPRNFFLVAESLKGQYHPRLHKEFESSVKKPTTNHNSNQIKINQEDGNQKLTTNIFFL